MSTRDKHYTRTGDNFFTTLSNWASLIPLPLIREIIVVPLGVVGAAWDAAGWLLQGKPLSAATAAGTGLTSTFVNAGASFGGVMNPIWWANVGSTVFTGRTLGTHARKGTEVVGEFVTRPLGIQPTVLRSHQAGIGSINGGFQAQRPGQWANYVSQRSGRDPNQQWTEYVQQNGGAQMGAYRG
ncbi:MAG: hypothetical protein ACOYJ2_07325 [Rickettsiales bacterium]